MRRVSTRRVHPLARLREERGAMAVVFALLMPVLFGASAIAIDVAGVWSARQQVESGADAAVLAVALDCASGDCGNIKTTAEDAFWANDRAAKLSDLGPGEGLVEASASGPAGTVSVTQTKPWVVNHFFAGALGQGTGALSVQSFARWVPAASGRADVPLGVSYCFYKESISENGPGYGNGKGSPGLTATATIPLTTSIESGNCPTPSGGPAPRGTAMSVPNAGSCTTKSTLNGTVTGSTKNYAALGPGCSTARLSKLVGGNIVVPVWDALTGADTPSPTFQVYGYAAFHVTKYVASGPALEGYFVYAGRQVDDTTPPTATTAPDLGSRAVFLDHQ